MLRYSKLIGAVLIVASLLLGVRGWKQLHTATVVIEWTTASELDVAGFNLYRSPSPSAPFERVNDALIPASEDPFTGGSYAYEDRELTPGRYIYQLEEVGMNGYTIRHNLLEVEAETGGWLELLAAILLGVIGWVGIGRKFIMNVKLPHWMAHPGWILIFSLFLTLPTLRGSLAAQSDSLSPGGPRPAGTKSSPRWLTPPHDSRLDMVSRTQQTPRYRITVDHDGLYQLTYQALSEAGMPVDEVDPQEFHLTSQGQEVAIFVRGDDDNVFELGEAIVFYGQKFYGDILAQRYADEDAHWLTYVRELPEGGATLWQPQFNAAMLEKYTDENVYWLTVGDVPDPARMATMDGAPHDTYPVPQYYTTTVHTEQAHEWYTYNFSGEDTWYWERVRTTSQRVYTTTLTALASGTYTATLRAEVAARVSSTSYNPDHHTIFYLNSLLTPLDDHLWYGISRYHFETPISQTALLEGENQLKLSLVFDAYPGQYTDDVYFDWFEIEYARSFQAEGDQLLFTRDEGGLIWQYEIPGFVSPSVEVYAVTDPLNPVRVLNPRLLAGELAFESSHVGEVSYFVVGSEAVQNPKQISAYLPPDFTLPADYLIVTHPDFLTAAQPLADYRASQGLTVRVIDVQDLYNQFNDGIFHPIAIKNFLAYTFAAWPEPPKYVVLVGDGHWNFKGYQSRYSPGLYDSPYPVFMPPNLAFVDPIQGEVDSANLLAAVVGADPLPDVYIGRMPVNTPEQLQAIIAKIIAYESAPPQEWQRHLLFIADNADDAGDFIASSDEIIADYIAPPFVADRIYSLTDYLNNGTCLLYNRCAPVAQEITATLNTTGALLVNYSGHASLNRWSHESIFINNDIASLTNGDRLPVVLTMDCLDGFWTYPSQSALMEDLLRAEGKGAVAAFSPTGLGVATGHDILQRGFYDALFHDNQRELGALALAAKVALYDAGGYPDLIQTYTIFGDPALRLHFWNTVFLPLIQR